MSGLMTRLFRPAPAAPAAPTPAPSLPDEDGLHACGWFDSSHDLLSGVLVHEGMIVADDTAATPP